MKFHRRIEPERARIATFAGKVTFHPDKKQFAYPKLRSFLAPNGGSAARVGQGSGAVNKKERLAINADVALIAKGSAQPSDMRAVVFFTVGLGK